MEELIRKYYQGELTVEERLDLLRKAESDKHLMDEFIRYQNLQAMMGLAPQTDDKTRAKNSYTDFIRITGKRQRRGLLVKTLRYAAAILILITGTWITAGFYFTRDDGTINILHAPTGQRACLTLNDGTEVWLNANSTLEYPSRFSRKERKVKLSGEAYFDVKKDLSHPFIVSTNDVHVKVLGTKFDIFSYSDADYMSASLFEGSVKVYEPDKEEDGITLKPNERLCFKNGIMTVEEIKNHADFLWRNGIYSFENEAFSTIIKKLELYYDVTIQVTTPSILDFEYTAKFRQRDGVDEILRQIQKTQKFKIEKDNENNIITLSK